MKTRPVVPLIVLFMLLSQLFIFSSLCFAQTSLSMNTYYVSPYGSYARVRLVPRDTIQDADAVCTDASIGLIYVEKPSGEEKSTLRFCNNMGGTATWSELSGPWTQNVTDIYPADLNASVLIGTDTNQLNTYIVNTDPGYNQPFDMLLSGGTGSADLRIEAATGGEDSETAGITLSANAGAAKGQLLLTSDKEILQTTTAMALHLGTQGTPRLAITSGGDVGVHDESPDALFEISYDGRDPALNDPDVFMVSSNTSADGNVFNLQIAADPNDRTGRTGVGNKAPAAPLEIAGLGSDGATISYGKRVASLNTTANVLYSPGSDQVSRFVHTGPADGRLSFESSVNPDSILNIFNDGTVYVPASFWLGNLVFGLLSTEIDLLVMNSSFQAAGNPFWYEVRALFSDEKTKTGITPPSGFTFIQTGTIGVMSAFSSQDVVDCAASGQCPSGLSILGLSASPVPVPPEQTSPVAPLTLAGAIGALSTGTIPAVDIEGYKTDASGNIVELGYSSSASDIVLSVNSATSGSTFTITDDGNVGIGMTAAQPRAMQRLHVRHVLRLEPQASAPACGQNGLMYVNNSGALCYCDGTSWHKFAGTGICE